MSDATWKTSWALAPQNYAEVGPAGPPPPDAFNNQTIRQNLHTTIGGSKVRVRFSNYYGSSPITVSGAHLAKSIGDSNIKPSTDTVLKFSGGMSVTIPAGAEVWSDAVSFNAGDDTDLAVTTYFAGQTPINTYHVGGGNETNYVVSGNALSAPSLPGATTKLSVFTPYGFLPSTHFVTGLDVQAPMKTNVVVALSDNLGAGVGSTLGASNSWTAVLADRLRGQVSVLSASIVGNRLLAPTWGDPGFSRFNRDVAGQSGASHVIIGMGLNDLVIEGLVPPEAKTVEQLQAGIQSVMDAAHARHMKVILATVSPFKGLVLFGSSIWNPSLEAKRQQFNSWIRTHGDVDGVIDIDAAVRDPADGAQYKPAFDSGDHVHPNPAGYAAIANAVDLRLLRDRDDRCDD